MTYEELRAQGRVPRVHGNGFIQLDLTDDGKRRLHVWSDRLPRQAVPTPIHDHAFDLRSEVIFGTLIHEELTAHLAAIGTHTVYRAQREEGTENTVLVRDGDYDVYLSLQQRLILRRGSIYTFPAGKLHETRHRGLTATVMEKTVGVSSYYRPQVLVPVGKTPDNTFHRDSFEEEFLWNIVMTVAPFIPG